MTTTNPTDAHVRGKLALITLCAFFGVAGLIVIPAGLGFTDFKIATEMLAIWGSVAGTLTGTVFGFYFAAR